MNYESRDVECPYCERWNDICHDDGYGTDEGVMYFQECAHCDKTFSYTTAIVLSYTSEKAPCKNGEPHNWHQIKGYPVECFIGRFRCSSCDKEEGRDEEGRRAALAKKFAAPITETV